VSTPINTGFTINPKLYDFLKFMAFVVLPAVATLLLAMVPLLNWSQGGVVAGIVTLVDTFLGTILGKSSANFAKEANFGDLVVGLDEHGNAEVKTFAGAREDPILKVGSKVTLNVVQDHTLPR
jgi:hypothetical protein